KSTTFILTLCPNFGEYHNKFKIKWDWEKLSLNTYLPWSIDLIDTYYSKWYWDCLSKNKGIPFTFLIIEKYYDLWNWDYLSDRIPILKEFIEKYLKKLNFYTISGRFNFSKWEIELIINNIEECNWCHLTGDYENLPWTEELMEKFQDKLDFGNKHSGGLSSNSNIKWTFSLIEKYKDKIYWSYLLSNLITNNSFDIIDLYIENFNKNSWSLESSNRRTWTIELLERYENYWDWYDITRNEGIPWSIQLIERFKNKWVNLSELIGNSFIYSIGNNLYENNFIYEKAFKPFLTKQLICKVIESLKTDANKIIIDKWELKLKYLKDSKKWEYLKLNANDFIDNYKYYDSFIYKVKIDNKLIIPEQISKILSEAYFLRGLSNFKIHDTTFHSISDWDKAIELGSKEAHFFLKYFKNKK
ncbi:MAG: hypothetical protein WCO13_14955, partial [Bacteroidota bacterium]